MNTNKRSITLDLSTEEGRRLFAELATGADVVIENFSPRVMDQFGLTADVLLKVNPKLVVAACPRSGWMARGATGSGSRPPWSRSPAWPG